MIRLMLRTRGFAEAKLCTRQFKANTQFSVLRQSKRSVESADLCVQRTRKGHIAGVDVSATQQGGVVRNVTCEPFELCDKVSIDQRGGTVRRRTEPTQYDTRSPRISVRREM